LSKACWASRDEADMAPTCGEPLYYLRPVRKAGNRDLSMIVKPGEKWDEVSDSAELCPYVAVKAPAQ
jgi:hypothetical protein